MPIAFWAISVAVEQMRMPTRKRGVLLGVLAACLLYLHMSSFVFFVLGSTGAAVVLARDVVRRPLRSIPGEVVRRLTWVPVVAALMVLVAGRSIVAHSHDMGGEYAGVTRYLPTRVLLSQLLPWMHDFWTSPWDTRLGIALWLVVAVLLAASIRRGRPEALTVVAMIIAAVAAGLYFLMPTQVDYAFLLDLRMAPVLGMTIGLLIHSQRERLNRVLFGVIAAIGIAIGVLSAVQMDRFEREEAAHFELLLRNLPAGKRLLMLTFRGDSQVTNIAPFIHFGSYYRARYGGIASFSFSELPHWPLRYRPETAPPKKHVTFWDWNPCLFRSSTDGPYYDFVLTRGDTQPFASHPPGPQWTVIGIARDWKLYARKPNAPPWPADSPDVGPCQVRPAGDGA